MFKKLLLVTLAAAALATGCSSGSSSSSGKRDLSEFMYLRGVFTWWDAEPEFQLKKTETTDVYYASAELVADGQPYDFKFADAGWSAGSNCGFKGKEDEVMEIGKRSKVNCSSAFENFKFTPPETGVYNFFIDVTKETPEAYIEKAQ
ncbi:hypothetical protein [Corallincola spongiicola]|uniref:Pullulanase n=1 Tax=Corallincola spongiicola TaxID=2520508 RepID=A0ABY1WL69_9GAMM|nr:hypothetical protein [Corallincola spongiicola]TAA41086.1 hypothetical protein EXY25_17450 [Corallincola spongiicola]